MSSESEQDPKNRTFVLMFVLAWVATVFFMNQLVHAYYQKTTTIQYNK